MPNIIPSLEPMMKAVSEEVQKLINERIAQAAKEEMGKAEKRVSERTPEIVAGAVLEMQRFIEYSRMDDRLVITIKLQK